jgi:cellulose 1,4-beta-cellobiosidase
MLFRKVAVSSLFVVLAACGCASRGSRGAGAVGSSEPERGNPFENVRYYINPDYVQKAEGAVAKASPVDAALIRKIEAYPTAIWLDSIAKAATIGRYLDDAAEQQLKTGQPTLTVFVVYDLPNRDCSAKSSAGELKVEENGEARYKAEFIDNITAQFQAHPKQPIVAILEPDSLANLATNLGVPKCAASQDAYMKSVAYAVSKLSLPNVSIYLDAAHAGWLGWDGNRSRIVTIFKQVLLMAGGVGKIRGFATNVSNFNTLTGRDGKKLEPSDPCPDEITYVHKLGDTLNRHGIKHKRFIIDTSRNGKGGLRRRWGSWCNVKGAGLGERPGVSQESGVDAYFWVKPPGESDGVSDPTQPRFDANCVSGDSAKGAPQAGEWFDAYFQDLVKNAQPPL